MDFLGYSIANKCEFSAESCSPFVRHWLTDAVDVKVVSEFDNGSPLFRRLSLDSFLSIVHIDNRSQSNKSINLVIHLSVVLGKSREHLRSSHGVTHVRYLVKAGDVSHVINTGREIVLAKLVEAIVVVLLHV